ncbi:hypothetical protein [Actinocorallia longicatena]|uniref:Helix-turn-helix domain-containing protein n=1 Tax=Actinocorallia longicatena TaxID=111803 RepID=A0ABP6QF47_9ACTN
MARDHGRIHWAMWNDQDFRDLDGDAQRLFMLALTQPGLSYAGVVPYTLRRWSQLARDSTVPKLRKAVTALEKARYVVVDEDAEELLIRSFIRNDGLLDSPNICRAMVKDFAAVGSSLLRSVIVCEIYRLATENPRQGNAKSWSEAIDPWFPGTLQQTFREGFQGTLSPTHLRALESVENQTLPQAISSARAAPAPAPKYGSSPQRPAGGLCEIHRITEPCGGCAADRKAIGGS